MKEKKKNQELEKELEFPLDHNTNLKSISDENMKLRKRVNDLEYRLFNNNK